MPKGTFKHFRNVSRRHLYRLLQQQANSLPGSTSSYPSQLNNLLDISSGSGPSEQVDYILDPIFCEINSNNSLSHSDNDCKDDGDDISYETSPNVDIYEIPAINKHVNCTSSDENNPTNDKNLDSNQNNLEPCSANYVAKLANWASHFNINQNAINALLEIQRCEPGYFQLPKDSRTLLKTPRTTIVRTVEPGQYHHFGLNFALESYLKSLNGLQPDLIEVLVGIDGLPISKSSTSQVWPILCSLKCALSSVASKVYPIGIYHGHEKPFCSNDYLKDFIEDAENLSRNGFKGISNTSIPIKIIGIVCDAPAKSFVLKTKGHTGYRSCSRCVQKGKSKDNRVYFEKTDCPVRTHLSFANQSQKKYHIGITDVLKLPNFNVIKNIPLDYMHLVCLGVVKKLIFMWLFCKKGPQRLAPFEVETISEKLLSLRGHIPLEFCRKPRRISDSVRWKATELRQFLLYSGPVVLKEVLNADVYLNFLSLNVAISILLSNKYCNIYLDYSDSLLKYFVSSFSVLYGKQFMSHNIHGLTHLKDDVLQYGPLDNCSAFAFENYMLTIKKFVQRKPEKPLQQFARRYAEMMNTVSSKQNDVIYPCLKKNHCEGPVVDNVPCSQFRQILLPKFILGTDVGNNCCKMVDGSVVIISNVIETNSVISIVGKPFSMLSEFYVKPFPSSNIGVYFGKHLGILQSWNVKDIMEKCIKLPFKDGYVIYPFLHEANDSSGN